MHPTRIRPFMCYRSCVESYSTAEVIGSILISRIYNRYNSLIVTRVQMALPFFQVCYVLYCEEFRMTDVALAKIQL
jgi:hypothetical protein